MKGYFEMPTPNPILTTYVFLDVVNFSRRDVGTQAHIVSELTAIVRAALAERQDIPDDKKILLPTGDGICISLQANEQMKFDAPLQLALHIIRQLHARSPELPEIDLRIGIDANNDIEVIDINGARNMAGAGINTAQRVMGLADRNQIIVSETVYNLLKHHSDYPPTSFKEFQTTVKHDEPITVYQYVENRYEAEGLNIEPPSSMRTPDLRKPGRQIGLVNIYPMRNEQVFHELRNDIARAQKRIWLSGIGLSEVVPLKELLPMLAEKSQVQVDEERKLQVRLLLLDAISSPAVFRTFLESSNQEFNEYLKADRHDAGVPLEDHPYFKHQLFNHFKEAYDRLDAVGALKDSVRFYAHNPNCWLAIVDDVAYFQPYTFGGKTSNEQGHFTIGHLMPVFKFRAGSQRDVFALLEDHFQKLWITTDTDLFHVGVRLANRDYFTRMILTIRKHWFKHVYGALHPIRRSQEGKYKPRLKPRKTCRLHKQRRQIKISWTVDNHEMEFKCPIINYSREGALLEVTGRPYPEPGEIVKLDIVPEDETENGADEPPEAKYLKYKLIRPTNYKFIVLRQEQRYDERKRKKANSGKNGENAIRTYIALQAYDSVAQNGLE
jgi:hypothetical protein